MRALASGFDAPTFESPLLREWSRGDFDVRHQFVIQGGVLVKGFALTLFGMFYPACRLHPWLAVM